MCEGVGYMYIRCGTAYVSNPGLLTTQGQSTATPLRVV